MSTVVKVITINSKGMMNWKDVFLEIDKSLEEGLSPKLRDIAREWPPSSHLHVDGDIFFVWGYTDDAESVVFNPYPCNPQNLGDRELINLCSQVPLAVLRLSGKEFCMDRLAAEYFRPLPGADVKTMLWADDV